MRGSNKSGPWKDFLVIFVMTTHEEAQREHEKQSTKVIVWRKKINKCRSREEEKRKTCIEADE